MLTEKGLLKPKYTLPYSDLKDLDSALLEEKRRKQETFIFGHTLADQINGQLEAGFLLSGFYEDEHPSPRFLIEHYTARHWICEVNDLKFSNGVRYN